MPPDKEPEIVQNDNAEFVMALYPLTLGIQCKTNGYLPPKERKRFKDVIKKWAMCSVLAYRDKRKLIFKDLKTQDILEI